MASRIDTPCRECHEKGENFKACHDVCEKYLKVKAEREREKEQIREAKNKRYIFDDYHMERLAVARKIRSGKDRK